MGKMVLVDSGHNGVWDWLGAGISTAGSERGKTEASYEMNMIEI